MKAMEVDEKPSEDYSDVGGLDKQIQELVEAIVLPVTHKACLLVVGILDCMSQQVQELVEASVLPVTHKACLLGVGLHEPADAGAGGGHCAASHAPGIFLGSSGAVRA